MMPLLALAMLGATTTHTLSPSATVVAKCTVSGAVPLAFGAYDPVVANLTSNLDVAPAALSLACTRGSPSVTIGLDLGLHAVGSTRYMVSGASALAYQIYTSATRTIIWNTSNMISYSSTTMAPTTHVVYGRIPSGQDASVGASYSDTITVTVNF